MYDEHRPDFSDPSAVIAHLEGELARLRSETPRRMDTLQHQLDQARRQLERVRGQNEKLGGLLTESREQLAMLRTEVERLTSPPNPFGTVLKVHTDGKVDLVTGTRKLRVDAQPSIEVKLLQPGQQVLLNEAYSIIDVRDFDGAGEVMVVKDRLDHDRLLVQAHGDENRVVWVAGPLQDRPLRMGDNVRVDVQGAMALERLARPEVEELILEEVPDVTYRQVGGLKSQIEIIRDAVELPYVHRELFSCYKLKPPQGILLYGPPGCGKTLIAKAVANSLATAVAERTGQPDTHSYFLNIKGPELLSKWVGETERQIRLIFQRAKEKASEGVPVIVFFDEMDSLFRTRGTGISSDVESTIVPQLLSELDGVESLRNVIVIGASNREDLIDPAILRPGRLDVKIKISRPDTSAAREIFGIYLTADLPYNASELAAARGDVDQLRTSMVRAVTEDMYSERKENRFLEVTYANGDREVLFFKDFSSGAMIENIVSRSKKSAIKRYLSGGEHGIGLQDLLAAVRREFREHEDLPNTTNPDDWAKISGKKGERIVYVRTLLEDGKGRMVETVTTGQYL
jgi:proteasome-associated ATPase